MADNLVKRSSSVPATKKDTLPDDTKISDHSPDVPECAVCLQTCIHPVKLPCTHIFCFLCVKGAANQSRRCALCRQAIPVEYFNNPTLVGKDVKETKEVDLETETDHYAWFYEGRNGWWQYDERTNVELEESYNAKKRSFELLIAGYMYVVDLDNMLQMRRHDQSRRRRIKRDLISAPKKGIAGLKIAAHQDSSAATEDQNSEPEKSETAAAGGCVPSQESVPSQENGTDHNSVSEHILDETNRRTAGVGRDAFAAVDQYDADDDGSDDDDDDDVQRPESQCDDQRSRPLQRGHSNHPVGTTKHPTATSQNINSSSRRNPQGLPTLMRPQRVSSAPETNPGRRNQQTSIVDPQQESVDATSVDDSMHSLQISTPDDVVYEVTTVPVQPTERAVRQRRTRQRQNDDVAL
ncbi:E3 ubiquitin-protein ligase rnf146-like [Asterias rubens]|uniref:E3 ubiquitin-protein ligase rnf146-like n=1 Tax=Asterias rubens TaxID=7604 RepID=UPI001455A6DE|nr:E3 ubiquitin-protein ligase rnf146-like [Asterias rubens]